MSLQDYADYQSSPQLANTPQTSIGNPNSFSVAWTGTPNAMGVKPPNPQFKPANLPSYVQAQTSGAAPSQYGSYPIGVLQSAREPYGVEYLWNAYGGLESKLGTNLGA